MDLAGGARRKSATRENINTLKAWLQEHIKNPYPSKGEKIMLAIITKMTLTQVSTWFANARRRLKKENQLTVLSPPLTSDAGVDDDFGGASASGDETHSEEHWTANIPNIRGNNRQVSFFIDSSTASPKSNNNNVRVTAGELSSTQRQGQTYINDDLGPDDPERIKRKIWSVSDFIHSTSDKHSRSPELGCCRSDRALLCPETDSTSGCHITLHKWKCDLHATKCDLQLSVHAVTSGHHSSIHPLPTGHHSSTHPLPTDHHSSTHPLPTGHHSSTHPLPTGHHSSIYPLLPSHHSSTHLFPPGHLSFIRSADLDHKPSVHEMPPSFHKMPPSFHKMQPSFHKMPAFIHDMDTSVQPQSSPGILRACLLAHRQPLGYAQEHVCARP